MNHPPLFKLDALAAGDPDAATGAHVASCDACTGYVKKLEEEAAAFRATSDAVAFAEKVARRAAPKRGGTLARLVWYAGPPLAAAAALAIWVGSGTPDIRHGRTTEVASLDESHVHFKGGLSVAVIRERGGAQERLSGPFEVLPEDLIRVEVAVDRDEPVTAGLLSADGSWTLLLAPAALAAGTHFSELAARFDRSETDAVLLVGAPEDVARARTTRKFDGVVAWPVRSEQ